MDRVENYSLICLSHLRWDFVYQRPQHLMSRFARNRRVYYFEEPIVSEEPTRLELTPRDEGLYVAVPLISRSDRDARGADAIQREMIDELIAAEKIDDFVLWYYTPMSLDFSEHLMPRAVVFDVMDELSAFKFAPPELIANEQRLLERADVVFTGGESLFEAKRDRHPNVHAFPSSIDVEHFAAAREIEEIPEEERSIPRPRFGFCGVIDERMDLHLLAEVAEMRPEWQFVMIGPVVKIGPDELPRRNNIRYIGGRDYKELPSYFAGWDIAIMPFAINEATRYISPTKTPEYLAAGLPVISTPIRDVVRPYGELGLVEIVSTAEEFVAAGERLRWSDREDLRRRADAFLKDISWDKTFAEMSRLIDESLARGAGIATSGAV